MKQDDHTHLILHSSMSERSKLQKSMMEVPCACTIMHKIAINGNLYLQLEKETLQEHENPPPMHNLVL